MLELPYPHNLFFPLALCCKYLSLDLFERKKSFPSWDRPEYQVC